ncbi:HET-domain-containing protein [Annulohypoxylon bovei var. microspora]|nr:HET-domain-containing protein [Annulohypoxylon bovei var. microspora]
MPIVTLSDGPNAPVGNEYCDYCYQLKDTLSREPPELLVITTEELENGMKMGCETCHFRYYAISTFYTSPETEVQFSQLQHFTFDNKVFYEIFKAAGLGDVGFSMIPERSMLAGNTRSEQTFWTIENWIQHCLSEHERCPAPSQSSYFPKRVLDVRNGYLVLREDLNESSYACLSHCWGPSQSPIKTLTKTIDDFKMDIPWASLSKTFQDAVDICRRLRIDYLWIDSICIIQDSKDDWDKESLKMADIYENAYLTIAATMSLDGTGGCYASTDPETMYCRPVIENSVYCRKKPPEFNQFYRNKDWPLLSRAWVYQEMRLSPRVLHFGSEEVIWQCRTCRRSESQSNDSDATTTLSYNDRYIPESDLLGWYNTVYEYSHLALTFEADRFAALAAVAQREATSRNTSDEFLLGLWKNNLLRDLLWQIVPHQQPPRRSKLKSPTWTWASIMSRVTWPELGRKKNLHLLNCTSIMHIDIQYIASPYLGRYEKAELHICAPLIATTLAEIGKDGIRGLLDGNYNLMLGDLKFLPKHQADYDFNANSGLLVDSNREVYFLPIAIQTDVVFDVLGLVLIRTEMESGSDPEYERIGMIAIQAIENSASVPPRPIRAAEFETTSTHLISHLSSLSTRCIKLV